MKIKTARILAGLAAAAVMLTGCSGSRDLDPLQVEILCGMWDDHQMEGRSPADARLQVYEGFLQVNDASEWPEAGEDIRASVEQGCPDMEEYVSEGLGY